MNIGLPEDSIPVISEGLSRLLADTYTLYLKTHYFHWNVTGPRFSELHAAFEEHYQALAIAVDDVAERIRTLGEEAPGSYSSFSALASIREASEVPSAEEMVKQLARDHETLVRTARGVLPDAQEAHDEGSIALITDRMAYHEKVAWMLRSMI